MADASITVRTPEVISDTVAKKEKKHKKTKAAKATKTQGKRGIRFSVRNKMILGTLFIVILVTLAISAIVYRRVSSSFIAQVGADTLSLTQVAASSVDGNLLGLLDAGGERGYANQQVKVALTHIEEHSDVHAIYTIGEREGQLVYLTDLRKETLCDPVESKWEAGVRAAIEGEGYVYNTIEKDSKGSYITAFAPIYGFGGDVVGALGIEYNANSIADTLRNILIAITEVGGTMIVLSIVLSILIASSITKGLKVVNNKVYDLVSNDGDLTKQIEIHNNDEVGDIARNINNLLEHIRGVVVNISDNSKTLSDSVATALDSTNETTAQLDNVSSTMETMSAAMQETSASLQQVQNSTSDIREEVEGMHANVIRGTDFAKAMGSRALELRQSSEVESANAQQAADDMTESLNEKIEKSKAVEDISKLTQTILDIASQTNLLSLNASIEAARAGEHGRGFAVVAEEISNLASNSANVAKEIQGISTNVIENVRDLAEEAGKMVEFVREKTIGGYTQMSEAGAQYEQDAQELTRMLLEMEAMSTSIDESMNSVSNAMEDVSLAVEESARGVSDVAVAVVSMSDSMKKNQTVANENSEIARHLDEEVNKFKY